MNKIHTKTYIEVMVSFIAFVILMSSYRTNQRVIDAYYEIGHAKTAVVATADIDTDK